MTPGMPVEGDRASLRVMVCSRCYLPGFRGGGPVRSLAHLVAALGAKVDFRIVTLDRDREEDPPYASVSVGAWQPVGAARVLYLPRRAITIRRLAREAAAVSPQVVYLNSCFDSIFTLKMLIARRLGMIPAVPVLLAPQGEFSIGALSIKPWKKAAFIRWARLAGLYRGIAWQASNEDERADILRTVAGVRPEAIRVVADLTGEVAGVLPSVTGPSAPTAVRLVFLSRISPKKNLDFALRVLAQVKIPVEFTMYGPIEDRVFWAGCEPLIAKLPSHIRAVYGGEVRPEDVRQTLARHDVFFFPTRGENFGHVIVEALSAGVPVLTSDRTPWTDLEAHGAGWNLPLDSEARFAAAIEQASRVVLADREAAGRRAHTYALGRIDTQAAIDKAYELFAGLAGQ